MAAEKETSDPAKHHFNKRFIGVTIAVATVTFILISLSTNNKNVTSEAYNQVSILEGPQLAQQSTGEQAVTLSQIHTTSPASQITKDMELTGEMRSDLLLTISPLSFLNERRTGIMPANSRISNSERETANLIAVTSQTPVITENKILTPENLGPVTEKNTFTPGQQRIEAIFDDFNDALTGFYVGMNTAGNYTTIVENNPVGFDNTPIVSSGKLGQSKGIFLGYNINQAFGIQLEYNYNSYEGTNYAQVSNIDNKKSLLLVYDQFPLVIKYRIPQMNYLNHRMKVLNIYAGIQYNKLKDYHLPQEQRYDDVKSPINENSISVVAGFDYDINVLPSLYLSLGARSHISTNIANDSYPISDNKSHSFSLGARVGVFYQFNKH